MVDDGLVRRAASNADGRGVAVRADRRWNDVPGRGRAHPPAGRSKLFIERLDDEELEVLQRALDKVSLDCSFG